MNFSPFYDIVLHIIVYPIPNDFLLDMKKTIMENITEYQLSIVFEGFEPFDLVIKRAVVPFTSKRLMNALPITNRAIKRSGKIVLPTQVKGMNENLVKQVKEGDVSLHASSGNITIYYENQSLNQEETYLGTISELERLLDTINKISLSVNVTVKQT